MRCSRRRRRVRPNRPAPGHLVLAPGLLGIPQLSDVTGERQLQRFGQVLEQVEAVSDLHRVRRPAAASRGIGAGAVTGDHLDARVLAQPGGERFGFAVGQQRHRAVPVKVHQHRAVGVPLAHRPVVHAQCRGRGVWRQECPPDQAQQGVLAGGQPYAVAQARTGRAAERQAHGSEPVGQPRRLARPGRGDAGQAFGKDATLTLGVVAEELPNAELDGNDMLSPGQVSQDAPIPTMGPPAWPAGCRAGTAPGGSERSG